MMVGATLVELRPRAIFAHRPSLYRWRSLVALAACVWALAVDALAQPATPHGVWLMDARVAVETFECNGLMCGRIVRLAVPRDASGERRSMAKRLVLQSRWRANLPGVSATGLKWCHARAHLCGFADPGREPVVGARATWC